MLLDSSVTVSCCICVFFCKQKTAYEMRISDWSSDVCSSDLVRLKLFGDGVAALKRYRAFNDSTLTLGKLRDDGKGGAIARFEEVTEIGRASCRERVCQYV